MSGPPNIPVARTEEWRRTSIEDGKPTHHTAMVDVADGEFVIVSYDVLAGLLATLGFARIDHIDADTDLEPDTEE